MAVRNSYIGLARKYRPQTFSDLVGQDQVARSLEQQVLQGKVSQAYIFSGPRGIGKTSAARILAKCLNCLQSEDPSPSPCGECEQCRTITNGNSMDVIEIDGASNNSVDDIRDLQETINQNPFSARKKIYIIDEVHMLSKGAFNALLKTLEEPPPFVVFIFATTEFERIPETIKSRCQPFQFRRISTEDIVRRLDHVAEKEKIEMDPGERRGILETIAFSVDGGLRDALMALDQIAAFSQGGVRLDETVRFLGVVEHDLLIQTVEWLHKRATRELLDMVNALVERGRDLERFVKNLLSFLRDLMILKSGGSEDLINLTGEKLERAKALLWKADENERPTEVLTYPALLNYIQVFMALEARIKEAVQVRIHLEFAFVKLTAIEPVVDIARLIENFDKWVGGEAAPAPHPQAAGGAPGQRSQAAPVSPAPDGPAPSSPPKPGTPDLFGRMQRSAASAPPAGAETAPSVPLHDADALWEMILAHRKSLGMALSIALKDCARPALDGDVLRLEIPRHSLSCDALQAPDNQARMRDFLQKLTGKLMRIQIVPAGAARTGAAQTLASGAAAAQTAPAPSPAAAPQVRESRSSGYAARSAANVPVFHDSDSEPPMEPPRDLVQNSAPSAYELYLAQNPAQQTHNSLKTNAPLREKAEMAQRFFEGRLLDASGREISL